MAEIVPVPEVAAGATEVVVSEWLVQTGAVFAAGDLLVVIETEKAIVEIEAERAATLLRPLVASGSLVEVGAPLALIGDPDEVGHDLDAILAELGVAAGSPAAVEPVRRDVPAEPAPASENPTNGRSPAAAAVEVEAPDLASPTTGRRFASPIARRLLREAGTSVDLVTGTGPAGRILRRDVEAHLRTQRAAPAPPVVAQATVMSAAEKVGTAIGPWVDSPHTRLRRAVATRLTASKRDIPHFYVRRAARIDTLLELRAQINATSEKRVSLNDLMLRAVAVAHGLVPDVNAIWTDEAVRKYEHVDIGVAIASPRGLVTPVLRGVESMSVGAVSAQVKLFASAAAEGRLKQSDLEGGSIAVTNLGMLDVDEFSAIINPPQSAILAVGVARREAVVGTLDDPDAIVAATVLRLVLSVDHRVIDGALAATWIAAVVDVLEDPIRLLV